MVVVDGHCRFTSMKFIEQRLGLLQIGGIEPPGEPPVDGSPRLAGLGGLAGLVAGLGIVSLIHVTIPTMPAQVAPVYVLLAEIIAVVIGLIAGVLPARRAAALEPLDALRTE